MNIRENIENLKNKKIENCRYCDSNNRADCEYCVHASENDEIDAKIRKLEKLEKEAEAKKAVKNQEIIRQENEDSKVRDIALQENIIDIIKKNLDLSINVTNMGYVKRKELVLTFRGEVISTAVIGYTEL